MTGRSLPRRWCSWVRHWWQSYFAPRRRPWIREQKPHLETLEPRFMLSTTPVVLPPTLSLTAMNVPTQAVSAASAISQHVHGGSAASAHHHHHPQGGDPLYVLDMNSGVTLPTNVTLNSFSNWSENLLAQVSGATVTSYSWNLSQAPDLTSVSGTSTANLQGTWANFSGAARTDTITVTETYGFFSTLSQTMTFQVASTSSPAYAGSRPTTSSTWQNVVTPDQITSQQATASGGPNASLGLADGSVQTSFTMPSYNPNADPLQLDYSSTAANAQPIFLVNYQLPSTLPTTVTAQLTLDSTLLSTVSYNPSSLNPGDWMQMGLQANATSLATGRYPWQISIYNGTSTVSYSGDVDIVNQSSSPYGAGWSLDNVEQLVPVSGSGVILVQPGGTSLWFANGSISGTFVTPAGDFSTLVQNVGGSYTRTMPDGTQINFNSSGLQTSVVDRDGNTTTFGYNGSSQLTAVTDFNGQQTTLAYNGSGELTAITDPASHSATMAYDASGRLTSLTDPAGAAWSYGYDSANDLTKLTDPLNNATTFNYDFADRVTSVSQADGTSLHLVAEQINGLASSGSSNVTATLLATGDQAQYTDPRSDVWTTGLDWLGFGLDVSDADPLGGTSLTYRDPNGLPWLSADALGRRTRDFFDSQGNTTKVVAADDTTQQYQYNSLGEVTHYTDQENNVTTYAYNSKGDQTQVTDALNETTTSAYNSAGLVTSTTDALSHTTSYAYDSLNRLTQTTNALSGTSTVAYNSAGEVTSSTDARGFTSTFAYDPMGRTTSQTLPDTTGVSSTTTFAYDKTGNQTSSTDPLGHTTTSAYDSLGRLSRVTDALGHAMTYGYDAAGNQTSMTDALGRQTTYGLDTAGRQTSMTDPAGDQTTTAYDLAGEQTSVTDPLGDRTVDTYTARGELASETVYSPLGVATRLTTIGRADCGCPVTVTVTNSGGLTPGSLGGGYLGMPTGSYSATMGGSVSGSFTVALSGSINDSNGNTIGSISGTLTGTLSGSLSSMLVLSGTYSASGSFTVSGKANGSGTLSISGTLSGSGAPGSGSIGGAVGATITGSIDSSGKVNGTLSGSSSVSLSGGGGGSGSASGSFTANGSPAQETTSYQRDALHRVTGMTDAAGNTFTYGYNTAGNQTSVTDALGHAVTYGYNAMNGMTSTTDALGHQTTFGYDSGGNQTSVTDSLGHATTSTYDAQGRLLTTTDPRGGVTSYSYDLAGNQTSITDSVGNQTTYGYDTANRLTRMTDPLGHSATYAYNSADQLTSQTDRDGRTTTFGYDNAGRETLETWVGGSYTATYTYNAAGQLTGAQDPSSKYTYTYDSAGDVISVDNAGTAGLPTVTLSYGYDGFGNRTSMTDSLGGSVTYGYDTANRLTSLGLSVSSTLDAQVTLGYDAASRLTGITRTGASGSHTITSSFSYDSVDRLTNITHADATASTTLANYTYGYDAADQLTSYQDSNSSLTYGYDNSGELTSATGTLNGSSYGVSYSYDLNGNRNMSGYTTGTGNELSSDGTYSYTYDNEGNLVTQTTIATGSVTYYSWDYRNRLTEVKQETSGFTVLNDEKFTYDVNNNRIGVSLNGTQQLYTVYDGSNPYIDFNGSGTLTQRYLTNPNELSQFYGQVSASGTTQWFLTDNINSIRQVVSSSSTSLDTITYDPYGSLVSQTNATNAPRMMYAGGAVDSITGNYQFGVRPDSPSDGRFLTPDWKGFAAGNPNLYGYVFNAPTYRADPTGFDAISKIKGTDSGVANIIDGMKNLTPDEKEKVKKEIQLLLDASRFEWSERTGFFGKCYDWVDKYLDNTKDLRARLEKEMKQYFQVKVMYWHSGPGFWTGFIDGGVGCGCASRLWEKVEPGHAAIQITFSDGTIIYLDDGNLGGVDHVFLPSEVPSNYYPYDGYPQPVKFGK